MENQHRKIKGYRELSQEEIDLMNRIKAKGAEMLELVAELNTNLDNDYLQKRDAVDAVRRLDTNWPDSEQNIEFERFTDAEPRHWLRIGKTNIQTGVMALVRAVAQPQD